MDDQGREERPLLDARDFDALEIGAERLKQVLHEVVRERSRQIDTLECQQDRRGLGLPDPDRQHSTGPLVFERAQNNDRLIGARIDGEACDANFDHENPSGAGELTSGRMKRHCPSYDTRPCNEGWSEHAVRGEDDDRREEFVDVTEQGGRGDSAMRASPTGLPWSRARTRPPASPSTRTPIPTSSETSSSGSSDGASRRRLAARRGQQRRPSEDGARWHERDAADSGGRRLRAGDVAGDLLRRIRRAEEPRFDVTVVSTAIDSMTRATEARVRRNRPADQRDRLLTTLEPLVYGMRAFRPDGPVAQLVRAHG